MESSFQKLIAALAGVMFMFIIPVYIAFEKVDDISYSLVLKFTQSFVDNVREKGYISPEMYTDYMANIYSTNNMYDVQIEHVKKRYDPAIYIYGTNGDVLHVLDYNTYISKYNSEKKLEIDEGVYTDKNSKIEIQNPSISILNPQKIGIADDYIDVDRKADKEAFEEELYREYITNFRSNNEEKIIFEKGEVYADRNQLARLGKTFDELIYNEATIEIDPGIMRVKNPKYEPNDIMSYDSYIANYDNSYKMDINGTEYSVFNGPKFTSSNIQNIKAAMWVGNKSYNNLTAKEKSDAEKLYYDEIEEYKKTGNELLVLKEGEIYSYLSSPNYNKWTDYIANSINVSGKITINKPSEWRVKNIQFNDNNIKKLRDGEKVVADSGGVFEKENITLVGGTVVGIKTGKQYEYTDEFVSAMLDERKTVTVQRAEVYKGDSIVLSDDATLVVKHLSEQLDEDGNPIYITDVNKWIEGIDEYIRLKNELENNYRVTVDGKEYSRTDGYNITLNEPVALFCNIKGEEYTRTLLYNTYKYINLYEQNGELVFSRDFDKSELKVEYRELKLYDENGNKKYHFKEKENSEEFKKYIDELEQNNKIELEKLQYSLDELTVEYNKIEINYGSGDLRTLRNSDEDFLSYVDGYYDNQRIVITEAQAYENVNVIHPEIKMKEGLSKVLYQYKRESSDPEEVFWWEYYSNKAKLEGSLNIIYKVSDVYVQREKLIIAPLKETAIEIYDNQYAGEGSNKYFDYKNEFITKGTVTFEAPFFLSKDDIKITNPKVTISNKATGNIIKEYTVGFDEENIFEDFDNRKNEYNNNNVIIDNPITYEDGKNCIMTTGHVINEERITEKQIVDKLFAGTDISKIQFLADCLAGNVDLYKSLAYMNENSYVMNEGDEVVVTVKNKNQTIASVFYSMFTANVGNEEVAKIYVNYGGNIKNDGATLLSDENGSIYSETGRLFKYKGEPEEVTLTKGRYKIECWGASGGGYYDASNNYTGGKGAYARINLNITDESKTVYVYVGSEGTAYSTDNTENGGWNGGGDSYLGYGGGGASDVRLLKGEEDTDISSLLTRIVVAAGGGGSSKEKGSGGPAGKISHAAGNSNGKTTVLDKNYVGKGATRDSLVTKNGYRISDEDETSWEEGGILNAEITYENGTFGAGGKADYLGAGGGGAGLVGGSASHNQYAGGGGGLSYTAYTNPIPSEGAHESVITYYESIRMVNKLIWEKYNSTLKNDVKLKNMYETEDVAGTLKNKWEVDGIFKWKGINVYSGQIAPGNVNDEGAFPNPLNYNGVEKLKGHIGNGYVRIKKIN